MGTWRLGTRGASVSQTKTDTPFLHALPQGSIRDSSPLSHDTVKLLFRLHSCEPQRPVPSPQARPLRPSQSPRGLMWTGTYWIRDEKSRS